MPAQPRYKIVVIETDDTVPRRDPAKPNLCVGITAAEDRSLEEIVAERPSWLGGTPVCFRHDLEPANCFRLKRRAVQKKKNLRCQLMAGGFTVNADNSEVYRLYVIELRPPADDPDAPEEVYVGETSIPIEARFEQHQGGGRLASRHVASRGVRMRYDLIPKSTYFSRKASLAAEARLAERLRERGFKVRGGH